MRVIRTRVRKPAARGASRRPGRASRFRRLAEAAFEGLAFIREGAIEDCSDQLARMLGCRRQELLKRPFLD
jgi:hypothetical protein